MPIKKRLVKVRRVKKPKLDGSGLFSSGLNLVKDVGNRLSGKKKVKKWDYKPKKGENHALFRVNGVLYRAFFAGPGTHILDNVKELVDRNKNNVSLAVKSDNFASETDREGLAHDIRYALADGDINNVRAADLKFISVLKRLIKEGEPQINVQPSLKAIQAKVSLEKSGALDPKKFIDEKVEPMDSNDEALLQNVLDHLEMQGFGDPIVTDRAVRDDGKVLCETCNKRLMPASMSSHKKSFGHIRLKNDRNF